MNANFSQSASSSSPPSPLPPPFPPPTSPPYVAPPQIGNAHKGKGLQKLRFWCELCQKQCRDENGFKCHQTSDGHRRQMLLFGQDPDAIIDRISAEFQAGYLDVLKRNYPNLRCHCNDAYRDYITDKQHVHMNATKRVTFRLDRRGLAFASARTCACPLSAPDLPTHPTPPHPTPLHMADPHRFRYPPRR